MTLLLAILLLAPAAGQNAGAADGAALFLESQAAALEGDLEKAEELAVASVDADPASPTLRIALAEILVQQGEVQRAKASLAEALRLDPEQSDALALLGGLAAMQGSLAEAETLLRRAYALKRDESLALQLAGLLGQQGRDAEAETILSEWDGPQAQRGLARLRLMRKDYAGAAAALRRVLDYAPGDTETLIALSRALEELGRLDEAAAAAEAAGAWKSSQQAAVRLASLLRRSDACPRAMEVLDAAEAVSVPAREERVQCLVRMGRWEEAHDLLSAVLEDAPDAFFSRFLLLRLDILEGRYDSARAGLDALGAEAPGDSVRGVLALEQALLYRLEGQAARAERVLRELQNDPDSFPDAPTNLMELYRAAGCMAQALETAEAMARRSPEGWRFHQQVLWALLDAGDLPSAELYLQHFREAYGANGWRDGGWALVEHGFPARGLEVAEAMALALGESRETRFLRAGAMEKMGRAEEAVAVFKALAADHPEDAIVLNFLGYTLVERGVDTRAALPILQKAVRLDPANGAVWDSLGWAHFALGNAKDAYLALKKANRLEPLDPTILEHLGDAEARLEMKDQAALHYRQALALGCERTEAILAKLAHLR